MSVALILVLSLAVVLVLVGVLRFAGYVPDNVNVLGPVLTVHTRRGVAFLDTVARAGRLWRLLTDLGAAFAGLIMAGAFVSILFSGWTAVTGSTATSAARPRNALLIPGVNDFLPLSVAPELFVALVTALLVHEGGHGLLCRVEDIDIESMGVTLFSFVPVGAFVRADPSSRDTRSPASRTRMFAAGVTANFLFAGLCVLVLAALVATAIVPVSGVAVGAVVPGSASADAGLESGDVVVGVDGRPVANRSQFQHHLDDAGRNVTLETATGRAATVERRLQVVSASPKAPFAPNATIRRVDGERVFTTDAFHERISNRTVVTVRSDARTATVAAGAAVTPAPDGALAAAGASSGKRVVVTHFDGRRTPNASALLAELRAARPGETVPVRVYSGEASATYSVQLQRGDAAGDARLGVRVEPGVSGFEVGDLGVEPYPAAGYAAALERGDDSLSGVVGLIALPFAGHLGVAPYNFAGFTGDVQSFYAVSAPTLGFDGAVFVLANVLFWAAWVNLNLGFFNCIPMIPLDGGRLLQIWSDAAASVLPEQYRQQIVAAVSGTTSVVMVTALLATLFAPKLL